MKKKEAIEAGMREHNRAAFPRTPAQMIEANLPLINKAFGMEVKPDTRKSKVVTFRTTEFMYERLEALSKDCGVSQSALIEDMIAQVLMEIDFTVPIRDALKSVYDTQGKAAGDAIIEAEQALPERIQFYSNACQRVLNMAKMAEQQKGEGE